MKFDGRGQKAVKHLLMERHCSLDHGGSAPLDQRAEELPSEVVTQDLTEDGDLGLGGREVHRKH